MWTRFETGGRVAPFAAGTPVRDTLDSERLRLRPPAPEDAGPITALLQEREVVEFLAAVPFPYTERDAAAFIASAEGRGPLDIGRARVIELRATGELLGTVGVKPYDLPDGRHVGEIGYWLGKPHWGQGYATEAVRALRDHCFAAAGFDALTATLDRDNQRSRRVLAKAGFAQVAMSDLWLPARKRSRPSLITSLDRRAWLEASGLRVVTVVAVALIDADDRILLAQRPEGKPLAGLWEFPGGKLEPGETPETALVRELREELSIDTEESCLAPFCFASHSYGTFHLLMPLFVCRVWKGNPVALEDQALRWVRVGDLANFAMPPADAPLVAMLRDYL